MNKLEMRSIVERRKVMLETFEKGQILPRIVKKVNKERVFIDSFLQNLQTQK